MEKIPQDYKKNIVEGQAKPESPMSADIVRARILVAQSLKRNKKEILEELQFLFSEKETKFFYERKNNFIYCIERENRRTGRKTKIEGLSINGIKDLANIFKHLDYGIKVLNNPGNKTAIGLAWCYDLQNNVSENREFPIVYPTWLSQKNFSDDSYKFAYSEGIRRMRMCIEHILPSWITQWYMVKIKQVQIDYKKSLLDIKDSKTNLFKEILERAKMLNKEITSDDLVYSIGLDENTELTAKDIQLLEEKLTSIETGEVDVFTVFPRLMGGEPPAEELPKDQSRNLLEEL